MILHFTEKEFQSRGKKVIESMKENFKAKVFLNKSGRGRVKYSEDEFLSLSNREMFKVFPGDEVVCQKMPGSKAKIKEVLKRNTSELTGIIKKYKYKH